MNKDNDPQAAMREAEPSTEAKEQDVSGELHVNPGKGFREPLGDNAIEHLRRYQVMTIPPSVRRALMGAQLPGIAPDLLSDTLPPERARQHVPADDTLQIETPVIDPSRQRRFRGIVGFIAALMLAVACIALVGRPHESRREVSAATSSPRQPRPTLTATPPAAASAVPVAKVPSEDAFKQVLEPVAGSRERPFAKNPATQNAAAPRRQRSVVSATQSASSNSPSPASVPVSPAPENSTGKGFRLGSR